MKTPCVAACKNNEGICSGCYRTMEEIAQWSRLTEEERDRLMTNLNSAGATHTCPSCQGPAQCDIQQGKSNCWCFGVEKRDTSSLPSSAACVCRQCLSKLPVE